MKQFNSQDMLTIISKTSPSINPDEPTHPRIFSFIKNSGEERSNTGSYCLIIKIKNGMDLKIGRKVKKYFPAGFYVYAGSAMNNLDRRIARHLSSDKKIHWHIDYLLEYSQLVNIFRIESTVRLECWISNFIYLKSKATVMEGFGASDCSCKTHLHYFWNSPEIILNNFFKEKGFIKMQYYKIFTQKESPGID